MLDAAAAVASVSPTLSLPTPDPAPTSEPQDAALSLNDATHDELVTLPFVGEYRARAIVRHRELHGPFASVFGLLWTGVFDPWTVAQLVDLVTV